MTLAQSLCLWIPFERITLRFTHELLQDNEFKVKFLAREKKFC